VPSTDPQKPPERVDGEAAEAWRRLRAGAHYREVAAELGVSVATLYRRLALLRDSEGGLPTAVRRELLSERLDGLYARLATRLEDPELPDAELARLTAQARQAVQAQASLHGANQQFPEDEPLGGAEEDTEPDAWTLAGRAYRDDQVAKINRREFGELPGGGGTGGTE